MFATSRALGTFWRNSIISPTRKLMLFFAPTRPAGYVRLFLLASDSERKILSLLFGYKGFQAERYPAQQEEGSNSLWKHVGSETVIWTSQ